jgi:integrase
LRIEVVYGADTLTCPVRAARRWLDLARLTDGPLLRTIDRHGNVSGRRLSGQAVGMVVKRHMGRLGYDSPDLAGHSLRRGMATTAARNGAAERTIMRTTGHTATETLRGYITDAEIFTDPGSGYLGL